MKQFSKTRILLESFATYADANNRASEDGICSYLTPDGKKCLLGRYLMNPEKFPCGDAHDLSRNNSLDHVLVPLARGHSVDFWQRGQYWHDNGCNFSNGKVNFIGINEMNTLLRTYGENLNREVPREIRSGKSAFEIILETISKFRKVSDRSLDQFSCCVYLGVNNNKCAVGQYLIEPGKYVGSFRQSYAIGHGFRYITDDKEVVPDITNGKHDEFLISDVRGFPIAFWQSLQGWHDNGYNFTTTFISDKGFDELEKLLLQYKNL